VHPLTGTHLLQEWRANISKYLRSFIEITRCGIEASLSIAKRLGNALANLVEDQGLGNSISTKKSNKEGGDDIELLLEITAFLPLVKNQLLEKESE
jgi:hypothetical protein